MSNTITLQRAYDHDPSPSGYRVLVDRLWPRGISKSELKLDEWLKDCAPSSELRKWFGHDPKRWDEFVKRYRRELESNGEDGLNRLLDLAREHDLVLIFGAKDEMHNNAIVLRDIINERLS